LHSVVPTADIKVPLAKGIESSFHAAKFVNQAEGRFVVNGEIDPGKCIFNTLGLGMRVIV
jgi:hypothetical protein